MKKPAQQIKPHPTSRQTEPEASKTIRKFSRDLVFRFKEKTPVAKGQK